MPLDGTLADAMHFADTPELSKPHLIDRRYVLCTAIACMAIGISAGMFVHGVKTFPAMEAAIPHPVPMPETTCDIRKLPLGISGDIVRQFCGESGKGASENQWVYGPGRYAYVEDGHLHAWQWDDTDSYYAEHVYTMTEAQGVLASLKGPPNATAHETIDIYRDINGNILRTFHGTHPINPTFCHPGYRP